MSILRKVGIENILNLIPNKRVLLRADFNVPVKDGKITDTKRIDATIPTIRKALDTGAKSVVIMSHLGRPDGKKNPKHSLKPVVPALESLLGRKVTFLNDCIGPDVESACNNAKPGEVILLENLRFYPEEEGSYIDDAGNKVKIPKDKMKAFGESLTKLGDIYINDAFGTAHRAHSSITGIKLPVRAAGYLLKKELDYFGKALEDPNRPFLMIMGGAKVKDKIQLINNLLEKSDEMIFGGGIAFTFLKRLRNMEIGGSIYDPEGAEVVDHVIKTAKDKGVKIHLPLDIVCAEAPESKDTKIVDIEQGVPSGLKGFDFGPKTIEQNSRIIERAKTIVWNGPLGLFEQPIFAKSSIAVLDAMGRATSNGAMTIAGGGDTGALIQSQNGESKISHLSTGGGASLELLEGKNLPGVEYLTNLDDLKMKA